MYSSDISRAVIDAVYTKAERLESRWSNVRLAIDFRDRMIDAVLLYLEKEQPRVFSPGEVENVLQFFWNRNARRDAVRAKGKPRVVSLTDFEAIAPQYEPDSSEDVFQCCREILSNAGFRPEVADAFIQKALHDNPDDVIRAVRVSCGFKLSADTLRQWKHRHFYRAAEVLRANAKAIGLTDELSLSQIEPTLGIGSPGVTE